MEEAKLHLEVAEKSMKYALEALERGDVYDVSMNAYKAAEEAVKALAEYLDLPEYKEAAKEERWPIYLLVKAANSLAVRLGMWVVDGFSSAYLLYVWGFHEGKLTVADVTSYLERVKEMVEEAKKSMKSS
mgnify:FL=1